MSNAILVHRASDEPISLTKVERKLLAQALMRGQESVDAVEDALESFGRWLLVEVFNDDANVALGDKRDNAVWRELVRRAGGPTFRVSTRMLYVCLQIAAHDKRITDEAWRKLEPGRKELLLPLGNEAAMRKAAQHVVAMKLSQRATRSYVKSLRGRQSEPRATRITAKSVITRVRGFRESFADENVAKIVTALASANPRERQETLREIRSIERALSKLRQRLS